MAQVMADFDKGTKGNKGNVNVSIVVKVDMFMKSVRPLLNLGRRWCCIKETEKGNASGQDDSDPAPCLWPSCVKGRHWANHCHSKYHDWMLLRSYRVQALPQPNKMGNQWCQSGYCSALPHSQLSAISKATHMAPRRDIISLTRGTVQSTGLDLPEAQRMTLIGGYKPTSVPMG